MNKTVKELEEERSDKLEKLCNDFDVRNRVDAPPIEFQEMYSRINALYACKIRMAEAGVTDESLIFNVGDIIGSKVYGTVNASPSYSFDKITAEWIEITNGKQGFKISADGDKVKIERM